MSIFDLLKGFVKFKHIHMVRMDPGISCQGNNLVPELSYRKYLFK